MKRFDDAFEKAVDAFEDMRRAAKYIMIVLDRHGDAALAVRPGLPEEYKFIVTRMYSEEYHSFAGGVYFSDFAEACDYWEALKEEEE